MLGLRRRSMALSAGSLELADPSAHRKEIFAFRRVYEDARRRESAEVFLNFSKREVPIDLRDRPLGPDALLHSNLHDTPVAAKTRHTLRPWEGAVVLDGQMA